MLIRQPANLFVSYEIDSRISHVTDGEFLVPKQAHGQSRSHASPARIIHPRFIDREIRPIKNLFQQLLGRGPWISVLKDSQRNIYGHFAGDLAISHSSNSVSYDRDSSLAAAYLFIAGFPVSERVLVFLAFRSRRGLREMAK